jgi:O-antigen/teichoic acid export membrane protein
MFNFLVNRVSKLLQSSRGRQLTFGVVSGIFIKGMALVFTLITVPMTIHYLGAERYGIWVTMISILAWISVVDIGVANGLTPLLTGAFGKNQSDLAQGYVATAFWSLIISSFLAGALFYVFWDWINWSRIFNIKSQDIVFEISTAMALAVFIFLINIPISITQRIYLADQKGAIANGWQFFGSLAGVIGIYWATKTQGGLVYLVLGYSGSQLIVGLLNSLWLFGFYRPELRPFRRPKFKDTQTVMAMGGMFFLNQLATLVVFQKDNILITHYLGPVQAANYSVLNCTQN